MGVTHVTVEQFAVFVNDNSYKTDAEKDGWAFGIEIKDGTFSVEKVEGCTWRNPSYVQKPNHPVVQVSWNDANAFCVWLSEKNGKTVTLPTEAQWEYACRAGVTTAYPWGDNPDDAKGWANCGDQSLKKILFNATGEWKFFGWDDGSVFASPVASFQPNAFGLYDMIGNAWQWCHDRYGSYGAAAATDPAGPVSNGPRVLRGGSWCVGPGGCRSAFRQRCVPNGRCIADGGCRVTVTVGAD